MDTKKQKTESSASRSKVWTSMAASTLAAVIGLISSLISAADFFRIPAAIVASIVAVAVTAGFTFTLARRERGPSRLAKLKDQIADAYVGALEESFLNPLRGGGP